MFERWGDAVAEIVPRVTFEISHSALNIPNNSFAESRASHAAYWRAIQARLIPIAAYSMIASLPANLRRAAKSSDCRLLQPSRAAYFRRRIISAATLASEANPNEAGSGIPRTVKN